MPQQVTTAVENNFTKGLITEYTGLNFPENAATDTNNCEYDITGDVTRRLGIDYEENFNYRLFDKTSKVITTYKWNNVSGFSNLQFIVVQIGATLYFYSSSAATPDSPISANRLSATVDLATYLPTNSTRNMANLPCEYAQGNGYLIVTHPSCDPFYCVYAGEQINTGVINVTIRDFDGTSDVANGVNIRPSELNVQHQYNLLNQGWVSSPPWTAQSNTLATLTTGGNYTFTIGGGFTINNGDRFVIYSRITGNDVATGSVVSYVGSNLNFNVLAVIRPFEATNNDRWQLVSTTSGYIGSFYSAAGVYPSNADVWWRLKDSTGVFNPTTMIGRVTLDSTPAPKGHYTYNAFIINRSASIAVDGINPVVTYSRPSTCSWYAGRAWYTGTIDQQIALSGAKFYSWTDQIYFSQVVSSPSDLGLCYQTNDPTSETLFDILPTDGGVIVIQGSGRIHKLFPIQNGMLVFADNGVWFITGSQGIGFTANDYTVTKISNVKSISSSSFVDVLGLPMFWNEEGIYQVSPAQQGGFSVEPLTVSTILSFYNDIPLSSKLNARGAYDPINYTVKWIYRSEPDNGNAQVKCTYDRILNFNTYNKAFYPFSVDSTDASINGIIYVNYPDSTNPPASIKYIVSSGPVNNSKVSFGDEHDENYVDWSSATEKNYDSYFITGYKLRGGAIRRFQPQYIQVYSRTNDEVNGYKIQGIWDFSNSGNSGRWSNVQRVVNGLSRYDTVYRRHKIRGHGYSLQFKLSSIDGMPFDIQGWSVMDTVNQGL